MTTLIDRHPWLCVPLVLAAFAVPSVLDAIVQWVLA